MKKANIILLFSLVFVLFTVNGCKDDPCENVVCLNGGACSDGTCICPSGYTGAHCETMVTTDPCTGITCLNGGACLSGVCICPDGWTGVLCQTPETTNPCAGINCQNGGTCVNGTCNCPTGWTGTLCQTPVTTDPCAGINCQNGGTCVNGVCDCPPGWTGTLCQTQINPCAGINCQNGGTCVSGTCNCPTGWTGTLCQTAATPTSVLVTKFVVTNYPSTSGGAGWDPFSGTDMYVALNQGSSAYNDVLWTSYYENATGTKTYNVNWTINNPTLDHVVSLWDSDSPDFDDFMCGVIFTPSEYSTNSPSTFTLITSDMTVTLHVTWFY